MLTEAQRSQILQKQYSFSNVILSQSQLLGLVYKLKDLYSFGKSDIVNYIKGCC